MKHDPGFAKVYMQEKKLLLDGMTKGNATLRNHAMKIVDQYHADNKE
jgi:hypothetical protein